MREVRDKAHAIMVNELVRVLEGKERVDSEIRLEVPFDSCGYKGVVDIVHSYTVLTNEPNDRRIRFLDIYELKTEIQDVGGALRQFNIYKEYLPKWFEKERALEPIFCMLNHFVLLSTKQNVNIILEFLPSFKGVLTDSVSEWEVIGLRKLAFGELPKTSWAYLLLFNPLNPDPSFPRVDLNKPKRELGSELLSVAPFKDRKDFLQSYRKSRQDR